LSHPKIRGSIDKRELRLLTVFFRQSTHNNLERRSRSSNGLEEVCSVPRPAEPIADENSPKNQKDPFGQQDFSLVLGGPVFQILRRSRLQGDHLELLHRSVLVIGLGAWLPLMFLSLFASHLGNSYSVVKERRWFPFGLDDITRLAAATALPLLPLALTVVSPEELIMRVIQIIF
jgi:hypothetical protein